MKFLLLQARIPIKKKLEIIKRFDNDENVPALAREFDISKQALYKIIDNRENYQEYSTKVPHHNERRISMKIVPVDEKLSSFIEKANQVNFPISRGLIQTIAVENASNKDFKASPGWFEKFKKRNNVNRVKLCGEAASVNEESLKRWIIEQSQHLLPYAKENVYNCDETGLFWKKFSQHTYAHPSFKGKLKGVKDDKSRLT